MILLLFSYNLKDDGVLDVHQYDLQILNFKIYATYAFTEKTH